MTKSRPKKRAFSFVKVVFCRGLNGVAAALFSLALFICCGDAGQTLEPPAALNLTFSEGAEHIYRVERKLLQNSAAVRDTYYIRETYESDSITPAMFSPASGATSWRVRIDSAAHFNENGATFWAAAGERFFSVSTNEVVRWSGNAPRVWLKAPLETGLEWDYNAYFGEDLLLQYYLSVDTVWQAPAGRYENCAYVVRAADTTSILRDVFSYEVVSQESGSLFFYERRIEYPNGEGPGVGAVVKRELIQRNP